MCGGGGGGGGGRCMCVWDYFETVCLHTGEFGIVYKAKLSVTDPVPLTVAVKTLKGQLMHMHVYALVCLH